MSYCGLTTDSFLEQLSHLIMNSTDIADINDVQDYIRSEHSFSMVNRIKSLLTNSQRASFTHIINFTRGKISTALEAA